MSVPTLKEINNDINAYKGVEGQRQAIIIKDDITFIFQYVNEHYIQYEIDFTIITLICC